MKIFVTVCGMRALQKTVQPDGSVMIRIIKQYNTSPVGDYLN